jgi:hypothetical protein
MKPLSAQVRSTILFKCFFFRHFMSSFFAFLEKISRYFKDHGAKIRTLFLALSGFVGFCRYLSVFVGFFLNKYLYNSQKITNFAA